MGRKRLVLVLLAGLAAGALAVGVALAGKGNGNDKTFEYAVGLWGDTPYSDVQALTGVPNLIADMNGQDIEFSVHDGDLKAGNAIAGSATPTTCQSALQPSIYSQALGYFNSLAKPGIFTPGDNDWTDCDRTTNGGFNSLERLQYERGVFFGTDLSLGQHPMRIEVQTAPLCLGTTSPTGSPTFATACVENRRWTFHKVTYATLNVQGSCNNLCSSGAGDPGGDPAEYAAREGADEQWLRETFDEASAQGSAAVMIIWQADPGFDTSGYQGARPSAIRRRSSRATGIPTGSTTSCRCCGTRRSHSRSPWCSSTATRTTSWSTSRSSTRAGAASRTSRASRPSATMRSARTRSGTRTTSTGSKRSSTRRAATCSRSSRRWSRPTE
jgi:hypothetical protein